jgi:predicted CxxxxCH...CXXCH cytochrome family protein
MRAGMAVVLCIVAGCTAGDISGEMKPPPDDTEPPSEEALLGCSIECHGADASNAPPKSVSGMTATTAVGVGAHQAHVSASPDWHLKVMCADCHKVPTDVNTPGHIDGDNKAEVTFSMRAGTSLWSGTSCTTGCHGKVAWGGTKTTPVWTQVDGTQSTCGSCHGAPPPSPHPVGANCAECHPTMEENSLTFRDPDSHINGTVDLVDPNQTGGCTQCHGTGTNAAPPKALNGSTARNYKGVGAHQNHLAASTWHRAVNCSSCHVVPTMQGSPGHIDGDNISEVKFDAQNPTGTYARGTGNCSTMYCHGNGRGNNGTINWLTVGPLPCNGCHSTNGTGMSGDHTRHINLGVSCFDCHQAVVDLGMQIVTPALHINGARDVKMGDGTYNINTKTCANPGCHGTQTW